MISVWAGAVRREPCIPVKSGALLDHAVSVEWLAGRALRFAETVKSVAQIHECLEIGTRDRFSMAKAALSQRTARYEGYLDEVREWQHLPSGAIVLAAPVPLERGVLPKRRRAKRKATAPPASAKQTEDRRCDAAADDAVSA